MKLRVSRTHLGQVGAAKTPAQVTAVVWKDPAVSTGVDEGWECWGELASTGM